MPKTIKKETIHAKGIDDVFDDYDKTVAHFWLCPKCKNRVIIEYKTKMKQLAEKAD